MHLDTAEIAKLHWDDAEFSGFTWVNDGKDLRLFLAHASKPIPGLVCHWASDLRVSLMWSRPPNSTPGNPIRRGGPLLTGDVTFTRNDAGRWCLSLDVLGNGQLECECESITTITPEETA